MIKILHVLICGLSICIRAESQHIIPLPQKMSFGTDSFNINKATVINVPNDLLNEAETFQRQLERLTGYHLLITERSQKSNVIILVKQSLRTGDGSYNINITKTTITITAADKKGMFYGCVSLLQLMPVPEARTGVPKTTVSIPSASISDFPRFRWRGLMLDLSRTFMSPDYIKRTITRMAFYKLNVLHLHLTDDQGWRLPVKSYPLLNERASTFDSSFHEPKEFQGFYTPADIKDILSYASSMHVEIIPEIESPGHSHAPLFAYPELSCNGNISPIFPFFSGQSVTDDVFCVGNPGSLKFFQAVITETAALFPSAYIHLGGDEVSRTEWEKCKKCQALVQSAKLENTSALQGYFMQQLHDHVVKEGKRPIAWDEILHDNKFLTKDWVIMSWTGSKPGLEAAAKGYDVVMTPTSHMYFDYPYDLINTKKVFEFDPVAGANADTIRKHVLGIQANFWSHIDRTQSKTDYQLYPRLLGLSERAWSSADNKDYENFRRRKLYHKHWLDYMDVKYYGGDFR